MLTLDYVETLGAKAIREIRAVGIKTPNMTQIKFKLMKSERVYGRCTGNLSTVHVKPIVIALNQYLANQDEAYNTMVHEMLHACCTTNCHHRGQWKQYAQLIGMRYGYSITRTDSKKLKGMPIKRKKLYIYQCPVCKKESERLKRYTPGREASCGRCCNVYNPKFKLVLIGEGSEYRNLS